MDSNTYDGWMEAGRAVAKGEKAGEYLVNPEHTVGLPLFRLDQTVPREQRITEGWTTMAAEDWLELKGARTEPRRSKVIVDYDTSSQMTTIWCGNNRRVIDILQHNRWMFDIRSHRWIRLGRDPAKTIEALEKLDLVIERGPGLEARDAA